MMTVGDKTGVGVADKKEVWLTPAWQVIFRQWFACAVEKIEK
jgi:hypothetical protein